MSGLNLEKHYSLNSSNNVKEICDPLLNSIGITYFNYIKIYHKDCSRELLTNNAEWIKHFYDNSLYNSIGAIDVEHLLPKGYFLWSELNTKDPIYLQGRDFFNIDNGVSFVIKRPDVTYLYIFASTKDKYEINNFYAGNIDLLKRFIHYFTDNGQFLIKEASKNRIYLPEKREIKTERINNILLTEEIRKNFMKKTKISRYFLLNQSDELYLTNKQAECVSLSMQGLTSKQIGKKVGISHRTVESYFLDIKNKIEDVIGSDLTKEELLTILRNSNLT